MKLPCSFSLSIFLALITGSSSCAIKPPGVQSGDLIHDALLGDAKFDGQLPPATGKGSIRSASDLDCKDWAGCRWRNAKGSEKVPDVDQMEWGRGTGTPDKGRQNLIFSTLTSPEGKWAVTGIGTKQDPVYGAMLVSDPIPCQEGPGTLKFKYWTSPRTRIQGCTRAPDGRSAFLQCSQEIELFDPGPATIAVPPSSDPFEIVIFAKRFDFQGAGQEGGIVLLDDIEYRATICSKQPLKDEKDYSTDYNTPTDTVTDPPPLPPGPEINTDYATDYYGTDAPTDYRPDLGPNPGPNPGPGPIPAAGALKAACEVVKCRDTFACKMDGVGTDWRLGSSSVGNRNTGIREPFKGDYLYSQGPGDKILKSKSFDIPQPTNLRYCFYRASAKATLKVLTVRNGRSEEIYDSPPINTNPHRWICETRRLKPGKYDELEFKAEGLRNENNYFALDEVDLGENADVTSPGYC